MMEKCLETTLTQDLQFKNELLQCGSLSENRACELKSGDLMEAKPEGVRSD